MVSRRQFLRVSGGPLLGSVAGCTGSPQSTRTTSRDETDESTPSATPTDRNETPSTTVAEWSPAWRTDVPQRHVLGLDSGDGELYATLSSEGGPSAVARVAPDDGTSTWHTELDGEAVSGSYVGYRPIARDKWGVTVSDERVYTVNGASDAFDWTAVHALDRETGERAWSLRRDRRLSVHGLTNGTVVVSGLEFFEPQHSHDTPEGPLTSILYGIDGDSGAVRWTAEFDGVEDVAVGNDTVYVAAGAKLVALDHEGEQRWQYASTHPARTVRVADHRVYYLTEKTHDRSPVHGIDLDGTRAWTHSFDVHEVVLDGDRLFAGGDVVLAIDPDGSVAWRDNSHGEWFVRGPAGKTLYTRAGGTKVGAYSLPDGDRLWSVGVREQYAWPVAATPDTAVTEGYAEGRALYAVDRTSGTVEKRYRAGDVSLFSTAALEDRIFVGNSRSTILALDT